MANQTFSFRLPDKLNKKLSAKARSLGRSRTSLIIEALNRVVDSDQPTPTGLIEDLQRQVKSLQKQVVKLNKTVYSEDGFLGRILDLEQRTADNEAKLGRRRIGAKLGDVADRYAAK